MCMFTSPAALARNEMTAAYEAWLPAMRAHRAETEFYLARPICPEVKAALKAAQVRLYRAENACHALGLNPYPAA